MPNLDILLGDKLFKLDDHDPLRRKPENSQREGEFICNFAPKEQSRVLFARFGKSKASFTLNLRGGLPDTGNYNSINFYIPEKAASKLPSPVLDCILDSFIASLKPYYADVDYREILFSRKPSPPTHTVYPSRELPGVFWRTYFGKDYRKFFSDAKLKGLAGGPHPSGGWLIKLSDHLADVTGEQRRHAEKHLGELSFASYGENKQLGQHVLTLEQLYELNQHLNS